MNACACPLHLGQRVHHTTYKSRRVTGVVHGLYVDHLRGLMVDCVLDEPIVIPPGDGFEGKTFYRQCAQAHEFTPFDERDEMLAELLAAARRALQVWPDNSEPDARLALRDAIAKAEGRT